jgi:CubicO group peptidase (beta-lactamase class C family)
VRLPRDLDAVTTVGEEEPPESGGMTEEAIERIWAAAVGLYRSGVHPALQLCLRREGRVVLDRAIGHAKGNGPRDGADVPKVLATPETPFCVFSTSKAMTAMVVHLLAERGVLDLEGLVADHIPEYASHGKEKTTIGHVLAHRAGVAALPRDALDFDRMEDRDFLLKTVCDARPAAEPGKLLGDSSSPRSSSGRPANASTVSSPRGSSSRSASAGPATGCGPRTSRWSG